MCFQGWPRTIREVQGKPTRKKYLFAHAQGRFEPEYLSLEPHDVTFVTTATGVRAEKHYSKRAIHVGGMMIKP
jgi:hypothetical protein